MRGVLMFLASRRWAGVGLALLSEVAVLVVLARLPDSDKIGLAGAVAAAIAATVAVVFGVADGVVVAAAGALAFAAVGGWRTGELIAIGVWPPIVAAAGLFARRVDRHRAAVRRLVDAHEEERRALALTLHDDSAQTLTGALLTLRAGLESGPEQARELINETIQQLRRLALDLSPKALEDYGLAAALAHLADSTDATFEPYWDGRLADAHERTLFRFAQAALAAARERGAQAVSMALGLDRGRVSVTVLADGALPPDSAELLPSALQERIRLLDGRVATRAEGGVLVFAADVPARLA